jgi:outer membrane protein OmpA-like peptidoglycan-associated protein
MHVPSISILVLSVGISLVSCKADEKEAAPASHARLEAVPASATPPRPTKSVSEEVEIDAHCEMISRDPEMLGRVRVDEGQVLVDSPRFFENGTAKIPVGAYGLLNEVSYQICKTPEIRLLEIGVHTSTRGSSAFNERLSQDRADALMEYLSDFIEPSRLQAKGYGESEGVSKGFYEFRIVQ